MVDKIRKQKANQSKTKKGKSIAVKIMLWVLCAAVLGFGVWLFKHYAGWVYVKKLFAAPAPVPAYTLTAAPERTPAPQAEAPAATQETAAQVNAAPVATPYLHPGDRDGKFTDGPPIAGELRYSSQDLSIEINRVQTETLTYFVAEVYTRDIGSFVAAFAGGKYGKGTEHTTDIAKQNDAVFAVSGDYYNARESGITIRNGKLYRDKPGKEDILAVFSDGSMAAYGPGEMTGEQLLAMGALHTYAFGPKLIDGGEVFNDEDNDFAFYVHPRCGLGMIEPYHYIFILVDGRKPGYSDGITINEFARLFESYNCTVAYNLDGGGSATMVFMDELVNHPQGTRRQRGIGDAIIIREYMVEQPSEQAGE